MHRARKSNWSVDTGLRLADSPQEPYIPPTVPAPVTDIAVLRKVDEEMVSFRLVDPNDQNAIEIGAHEGYGPMQVLYRNQDNTRIIIASDPELYIWDGVSNEILFQGQASAKQQYLPRAVVDPQVVVTC